MVRKKTGALKGSIFEERINETNEKYREQGVALVNKFPTPIIPMVQDHKRHVITLAFFEQKSTVDYVGVTGGVAVCFDAKECGEGSFPLQNIARHQICYMEDFEKQGGVAFLLIWFKREKEDTYCYVPFRLVRKFLARAENGGRKSFRLDELDDKWKFYGTGSYPVPYLKMIRTDQQDRCSRQATMSVTAGA